MTIVPIQMEESAEKRERRIRLNLGVWGENEKIYKECRKCRNVYTKDYFKEDETRGDLLNVFCLSCN